MFAHACCVSDCKGICTCATPFMVISPTRDPPYCWNRQNARTRNSCKSGTVVDGFGIVDVVCTMNITSRLASSLHPKSYPWQRVVGDTEGEREGAWDGDLLGVRDGECVGKWVGCLVGDFDGALLGVCDGLDVVGDLLGDLDGALEGDLDGALEGDFDGDFEGVRLGVVVGYDTVGASVGKIVGVREVGVVGVVGGPPPPPPGVVGLRDGDLLGWCVFVVGDLLGDEVGWTRVAQSPFAVDAYMDGAVQDAPASTVPSAGMEPTVVHLHSWYGGLKP